MVIIEKVSILYLMNCAIREEQLSSSPVESRASRKAKQPAREVGSHQIYAFLSNPVCVLWLPSAIQITKYGMSFCVGLGRLARKYICPTIARYLLAADIRFVLSPASWAIAGGAEGRSVMQGSGRPTVDAFSRCITDGDGPSWIGMNVAPAGQEAVLIWQLREQWHLLISAIMCLSTFSWINSPAITFGKGQLLEFCSAIRILQDLGFFELIHTNSLCVWFD